MFLMALRYSGTLAAAFTPVEHGHKVNVYVVGKTSHKTIGFLYKLFESRVETRSSIHLPTSWNRQANKCILAFNVLR